MNNNASVEVPNHFNNASGGGGDGAPNKSPILRHRESSSSAASSSSSSQKPQYRWEKWTFCNSPPSPRQTFSLGRPSGDGGRSSSFSNAHGSMLYSDSGWIMEHPIPYSETDNKGGFGLLPPSGLSLSAGALTHTPGPYGPCSCGSAFCSCFSSFSTSPRSSSPRSTPLSSPRPASSTTGSTQPPKLQQPQQWIIKPPINSSSSSSSSGASTPVASTPRNRRSLKVSKEERVLRRSSSAPERDSLYASENCPFTPATKATHPRSSTLVHSSNSWKSATDLLGRQKKTAPPVESAGTRETQQDGHSITVPAAAATSQSPRSSPGIGKFLVVYRDKIWLLFPILPEWLTQSNLDSVFAPSEPVVPTEMSLCLHVAAALGARTSGDMKTAEQLLARALRMAEFLLERQQTKPAHQLYWLALGLFGLSFYVLDPLNMQVSSKYLLMAMKLCEKIEARRSVVYIKCICLLVSHGTPELEETLRNQIMLTLRAIMDLPLEHTFPFSTTHISDEMVKALRFLLKTESLWAFIIDGPPQDDTYQGDAFYLQAVKRLDEVEEELKEFEELLICLADGRSDTNNNNVTTNTTNDALTSSSPSLSMPSLWSRPLYFDPSITAFILFTTKTLKAECHRELGNINMAVEWAINAFEVARNDLEYFQPTSLCTLDSLFHIFMQSDRRYAHALIEVIGVLEQRHVAASFIRHKYDTVLEREEDEEARRLQSQQQQQAYAGYPLRELAQPVVSTCLVLSSSSAESMPQTTTFFPSGSPLQQHPQPNVAAAQQPPPLTQTIPGLSQLSQSSTSVAGGQHHFAAPRQVSPRTKARNRRSAPRQGAGSTQAGSPQLPRQASASAILTRGGTPTGTFRGIYLSQGYTLINASSSPPSTQPLAERKLTAPGGHQKAVPPFLSSRSQSAPQLLAHARPSVASAVPLSFLPYPPHPSTFLQEHQPPNHHQHQDHHHHFAQHQHQRQHQHQQPFSPTYGLPLGPSALPIQLPPELIEPSAVFGGLELELCDWTLDESSGQGGSGPMEMPRSPDGMFMSDELKPEEMDPLPPPRSVAPAHIFGSHSGYLGAQLHA
ncbi:uncharacterized protein ACA1_373570 [Acanthamoeba castellanii str. Neff]|uniref:Uncharacterized protein n=1 Tax=Acanthamoeba castellanii (strain ATCC 30010 / Neff) TaxID=1257118 RepID=L8GHG5_ACACF|nr:uncharacterized protein ACA1_373570 [Acanthamoeba castellanii str. Neff]ELR12294.1 hypothetical protein ACA1_373570 [Acanthamoeba castellanii str. Neff]